MTRHTELLLEANLLLEAVHETQQRQDYPLLYSILEDDKGDNSRVDTDREDDEYDDWRDEEGMDDDWEDEDEEEAHIGPQPMCSICGRVTWNPCAF